MLSNSLRAGAAAARTLSQRAVSGNINVTVPVITGRVAVSAFQAQPIRRFTAAAVVSAAAAATKTKAAPKKKTAAKKPAAKKAAVKKPAAKKKPLSEAAKEKKAKAAAAAKEKKAKAAAAAKAKAKTLKAKVKAREAAQDPVRKARAQKRELRKAALLDEPSRAPEQPWVLYVTEQSKGISAKDSTTGRSSMTTRMAELAVTYKALPTLELQRLQDQAAKNKAANEAALRKWIEGFTPAQIADANRARAHLNRLEGPSKTKYSKSKLKPIPDERLPKRAISAFTQFTKDRWASGEFTGRPVIETARTLAAEWKNLPASERQHYENVQKAELERYNAEVASAFGSKSPSPSA